eukprot:529109-Prymnesium_polylepis.1
MRRQAKLARKQTEEAERKARKQAARERKEEELKRLKNLKKQEIHTRLAEIQKVSGSAVPISEVDLSGDFDPEEWDKKMAAMLDVRRRLLRAGGRGLQAGGGARGGGQRGGAARGLRGDVGAAEEEQGQEGAAERAAVHGRVLRARLRGRH